jgi:hypothetical protein
VRDATGEWAGGCAGCVDTGGRDTGGRDEDGEVDDDLGVSGRVLGTDDDAQVDRVVATPATPAECAPPGGFAAFVRPPCAAADDACVATGLARSCTGSATSPTVNGCRCRASTMIIPTTTKKRTIVTPMSACWRCSGFGELRRRWADGDMAAPL